MKHTMLLLSAATLALAPLISNAKNQRTDSDFAPIEVGACSCAQPRDVEVTTINEDGSETTVAGKQYDCGVTWTDVIADSVNPATYGASFDVEVLDQDTGDVQELDADIDLDWSAVCADGTCTVEQGAAPFVLTDYAGQQVTVGASVKAFENGKNGKTPRNFEKSSTPEPCEIGPPPADPTQ